MNKIKTKDKVIVITGVNKGLMGVVSQVFPKKKTAIVTGINKVKRHMKHNDPKKQIIEKEAPIHLSNLLLVNKNDKKTKVSFKTENNIKFRWDSKNNKKIEK